MYFGRRYFEDVGGGSFAACEGAIVTPNPASVICVEASLVKLDNDHKKRWQPMSCTRVVIIGYGKTASRASEIRYVY